MPVTEVAILPLLPGVDVNHYSVRDKLRYTQQVMENALGVPGRRFVYYQGMDAGKHELYLLGDWQSAAEHRDEFLPSPANQAQLAWVADLFDLARVDLFHVDVPAAQLPTDADVLTIGRHRVPVGARGEDKAVFEARFIKECRELCRHYGRDGDKKPPVGGWRIEKDAAAASAAAATGAVAGKEDAEEEEEWVAFCGWESAEERIKFAGTKWFGWKDVKLGRRIAL